MAGQRDEAVFDQSERLEGGEVRLVVPAAPEYLRLVRLTAAGLASRMGFTFDEVEDLRIAVDEVCYLLLGDDGDDGGERTIELCYRAGPDSIGIEGSTRLEGAAPEPTELSMQILTALVDDVEISARGGNIGFRLLKARETV